MPEDRMQQLFEQIAQADVRVPPASQVLARGRQRRHRARLAAIAAALAVLVAAGLGARQLVGATANSPPVTRSTTPSVPRPRILPPSGSGTLILALDGTGRFVMTRVGSTAAPVPVPGLTAIANGPSVIASNPGGGWVVTYSADPGASFGYQPSRLALVTATGNSEPFGPVYRQSSVTSVAVSPDSSRVAVAILGPLGSSSTIVVRPMPGHHATARTWSVPATEANTVVSLSWAPDGRRLSYIAGAQTGGGLAGGVETLDTAAPGSVAPGRSPWPPASKSGQAPACTPDAAVWLGTSGRLVALEECGGSGAGPAHEILLPVRPSSGAAAGAALVVAHQTGCGSPGLQPSPDGSRVLISYCGLFLDARGKLSKLPGSLLAAALAG